MLYGKRWYPCWECQGQGYHEDYEDDHQVDCQGDCVNCPIQVPIQEPCLECLASGLVVYSTLKDQVTHGVIDNLRVIELLEEYKDHVIN